MTYSAEERLSDYCETMEHMAAIAEQLKKLDMDTIEVNARQLENAAVQIGAVSLREFVENVRWYIEFYNEKITGIREYVRGVREKEQEAQEREYTRSVRYTG